MSEGEAKALEEAASMLDETRIPEGALPEVEAAPEAEKPDGSETQAPR